MKKEECISKSLNIEEIKTLRIKIKEEVIVRQVDNNLIEIKMISIVEIYKDQDNNLEIIIIINTQMIETKILQ